MPPNRLAILLAGCLAILAAAVCYWSMSRGAGITPDSLVYFGAAESIAAGKGVTTVSSHYTPLTPGGAPLTLFPPGYPVLIAALIKLGLPVALGAKWLNVIITAVTVFLIGLLTSLGTRSTALATLGSALLWMTSAHIVNVDTMAWSDGPFIMFCLLASVLIVKHVNSSHRLFLAGAALAGGFAMMTRYVGVTIIPAMIVCIVFSHRKMIRDRFIDALILITLSVLPLGVWLIRNLWLTDSATARSLAFHLPGRNDLAMFIDSLTLLWMPWNNSPGLRILLLASGGPLTVVAVMVAIRKSKENTERSVPLFTATFAAAYLLFLFAYNITVNPAVELDTRLLAPFFVFVNIAAISAAFQLAGSGSFKIALPALLGGVFLLIVLNGRYTVPFIVERHNSGSGYASRQWSESAMIDFVKRSNDGRTIYSNGVDAIAFLTSKEALRLPAKIDPVSWRANDDFDRQIAAINLEVAQRRAVIVYFNTVTWRYYLPGREELEQTYKLPVMQHFDDGTVYGSQ